MGPAHPVPEARWEIWYEDLFDRECPRSVDVDGVGLVKGLTELWARHLLESVMENGSTGFARFNLWWAEKGQSIAVAGDWDGQTQLRKWVFGNRRTARGGYAQGGDVRLLAEVALTHCSLILANQTSEPILTAAKASVSREDFERRLPSLTVTD